MNIEKKYPEKPKVLVISYLFPNSQYPEFGIFVLNRLKAISKYCSITVINPIPWFPLSHKLNRYENFNKIPEFERIEGLPVYHPRFFIIPKYCKFIDPFFYFYSVFSVLKKNREKIRFDLIDLHWTYPDILSGKILSKMYRKKWIINIRGKAAMNIVPERKTERFKQERSLRHCILKKNIVYPDKVITLSNELKRICNKTGVGSDKIKTIHNGVDVETFYYVDKKSARERLNLSEDKIILFSVGNLIYGKGFDRIINGFADILSEYENVIYYIAGSTGAAGDYLKSLRTLINKTGLQNHVILLGQLKHGKLPLWYNASDLFCLPSRSEGCPNVLMEALACGCPCVATHVGMVSEIFKDDPMGKLVQNEGKSIIEGIKRLLSKRFDRKQISILMKQHTWDACARKVVSEYLELIN